MIARKLVLTACALMLLALVGLAQAPASAPAASAAQAGGPAAGPAAGRGGNAPIVSPEVAADGKVTFRLRAPNAKDVHVAVGRQNLPMTKNDQGVWTATSDAMTPDYYTYSFNEDGVTMNDPSNREMQTSYGSASSMLVVPGPQAWFPQPGVSRGAIARFTFHSTVANDDRDFFVYTPANYDAHRAQAYPVLYLLHGLGDDAARWVNSGGANNILDNLIAQGKALPMVMVTTLGYGMADGPAGVTGHNGETITNYTKVLLDEVMPRVEKGYNVSTNREQRAIAGLSMGGAETMYAGLNHLDKFAWMGSFSGAYVMWPGANAQTPAATPAATPTDAGAPAGRGGRGGAPAVQVMDEAAFAKNFPTLDAKANSQIRMLWIVCGTADGLIGVNRQFKSWLKTKNVNFTEQEVPDMGHVWPLWRQNLTDLAQKLFQPKGK